MLSETPDTSAVTASSTDSFVPQAQQDQSSSPKKLLPGVSSPRHSVDLSLSAPRPERRESTTTASPQLNPLTLPRPSLEPFQEYHSGYSDDGVASPSSHYRRHQSLLSLPFRNKTPSPTRRTARFAEMPLTGDGRSGMAESSRSGTFSSWLSGGTAAIADNRANGRDHGSKIDATPDTTPTGPTGRRTTISTGSENSPKSAMTTTATRFMSAISRFTSPVSPIALDNNETCSLNIEAALFPPSSPTSRDPFSPAAFKNLQTNAVGLLTKMQHAYRQQAMTLKEMEAERGAQRDELEEAETRAQHLKWQLEGMARRAQEQEKAMQQLTEELAAERRTRMEEQVAREKGITIVTEGSVLSEDLSVDDDERHRKWRTSAGTIRSEASIDTDEESAESDSVFSRSRSPTLPPGAYDGSLLDGQTLQHSRIRSLAPPKSKSEQQQMTAFQKTVKGMTGEADHGSADSCLNCKGQDASIAWDTVSLLRDENKHLKQRVGALEVAVEGALDLVNGVGL